MRYSLFPSGFRLRQRDNAWVRQLGLVYLLQILDHGVRPDAHADFHAGHGRLPDDLHGAFYLLCL